MKKFLFLMTVLCALVACSDDHSDVRPGLWTAQDIIETFPGDTVLVQGQVSNYVGLRSVEIQCEAWGIDQVYRLDGKHAKVFNYNYQMPVPVNATFDAELKITVTDTEGTENRKTIAMTYLPDTEAPTDQSGQDWQMSFDFDAAIGGANIPLRITVSDDRELKQAVINVPALGYTKTISLSSRSAIIADDFLIDQIGNFDMSVEVSDATGNTTTIWHQLVVMLTEDEDPIEDYPVMWMVNASENAADYLDGYYAPLMRQDAYQYQGSFYADKDGYQLYIVPTKTMDSDLFGSSPYVSSKLMNKAGYVVPVTIKSKGYYGIWIDINAHSWSVWSLDTSGKYTGTLTVSGCGFKDFGDWGTPASAMNRDGFRYTYALEQDGTYAGTRQYYAADTATWGYILRWWSDASSCGWWEDTGGWGGSVGTYTSDYDGPVEVMFDTAILWGTIKKKH